MKLVYTFWIIGIFRNPDIFNSQNSYTHTHTYALRTTKCKKREKERQREREREGEGIIEGPRLVLYEFPRGRKNRAGCELSHEDSPSLPPSIQSPDSENVQL